jgi:Domain of unknown function (DUF1990)
MTPTQNGSGLLQSLKRIWHGLWHPPKEQAALMPAPPEIDAALLDDQVQLEGEGFGKLLGRHYEIRFRSDLEPAVLMRLVHQNVAWLSPEALANFEKTAGSQWALRVGDEFEIAILGPWNGKVRVIAVDDTSFSFMTLKGHPEAGRIRFAAAKAAEGQLRFTIDSWARSRDAVVSTAYALGGKSVQTTTWQTFLERVMLLANGQPIGEVTTFERDLEGANVPGLVTQKAV